MFPFHKTFRPNLRPIHRLEWVPGALSLGIKRQGAEFDHLLLYSVQVSNVWSYTVTPAMYSHRLVFD